MSKVKRGNYVFLSWKGDHSPRHVHAYRAGKLILKWDLDNEQAMKGSPSRQILDIIAELESEGSI